MIDPEQIGRAQGCLMGQLAGDSLGSLVEFQTSQQIRQKYPQGIRDLADGGVWGTLAGQPTDDSEMALALARMLVDQGHYDPQCAFAAYRAWFDSHPFDMGSTIAGALTGVVNPESQANGALMRVSPLGIFASHHTWESAAEWARQDARLTHPNPVCEQANALFVGALAHAIRWGTGPRELYQVIRDRAMSMKVESTLYNAITQAAQTLPRTYTRQQGWVLIAIRNALWQLLHAPDCEAGIIDTVMRGGDTDTNAAICGALLGAVYGLDSLPARWVHKILGCRPMKDAPGVRRPRPECYWPVDALELAEQLLGSGERASSPTLLH